MTDNQSVANPAKGKYVRISKDPDVRKHEFIDAARALFLEKGYNETSVSDIVKTVGVAQGTFYYYFKSKDDILDAVSEKIFEGLERDIGEIFTEPAKTASGRINDMLNRLYSYRRSLDGILEQLHTDSNLALHNRLSQKTQERLTRMFASALKQGIRAGEFTIHHPDETAELLSSMMHYVWHLPLLEGEQGDRIRLAIEEIFSRSVGMKDTRKFRLIF